MLLLALLLQVGPNPLAGGLPDDALVRERPARPARSDTPGEAEGAAKAAINPTSAWLEDCFDQIAADPARAHAMAQIRREETRGADRVLANHCLGTAAAELGRWDEARAAFAAALGETPPGEPRLRARFGALSGNAALAAGDAEGALALLAAAEADARAGDDPLLEAIAATDRARALVALGRESEALGPLETATTRAPERGEGWLLRATLLRRLARLAEAQAAIEQAAVRSPGDPLVGLEAGVIAMLGGREAAARASWQSVLVLAADGPAAETARAYLAQLGPEGDNGPAPILPDSQPQKSPQP